MNIAEIPTITVSEIQPMYLLFLNGKKELARDIQWFQKKKYGEVLKNGLDSFWYLNHVGFFDEYIDKKKFVYEQDNPGKFQPSPFNEEYLLDKENVYIGIPKIDLSKGIDGMRYDAEILAGQDVIVNYSYKSFISFMANAIWYKWFKKDIWITGKPKGSTCSQITAKFYQKHYGLFQTKEWYKFFPCELAQSPQIEIYRLIY